MIWPHRDASPRPMLISLGRNFFAGPAFGQVERGLIDIAGLMPRRTGGQPIMIPKRPHFLWHELVTPEERSKIDELDRSIADLRCRRQALANRARFRTQECLEHHGPSTTLRQVNPTPATHLHPPPSPLHS